MWLGTWLSVCLGEMSTFGRLKMQCLYVAVTTTECHLGEVSAYGRLIMQCLYVAVTTTECMLWRGVCLWEVSNAEFLCGWGLE